MFNEEAKTIHKLIQEDDPIITWPLFQRIINDLKNKKILQGENTLYITPKLLHIKLWIDWWEIYGSTFTHDEFLSAFSPPLLDWFFEMFEYAAGSDVASQQVRKLLGANGLFQLHPEILKTERGARFFRFLGEVEPIAAIKCLQKTIGRWDKDTLLKFSDGRSNIVWLLEKTAQWRDLFIPSAKLLLRLAEAENQSWMNNASGIFSELFTISRFREFSKTEASPSERFPVLEEALNSESSERRNLALQACNKALSEQNFGTVNQSRIFDQIPNLWIPKTWGEIFDAYTQIWKLLISKLDNLPLEEQVEASDILTQHIRDLGRNLNLAKMIADDVLSLATKPYFSDEKLLETVIQLLHYGQNLTPEVRALWEQVKNELSGDDYHSAMKRYVRMNVIEDIYDEDGNRTRSVEIKIQELAKESFKKPQLLFDELSWLVTTDASKGYYFGYNLAQEDEIFSLLPNLLDAQKKTREKASLNFLGGYLRGLFEKNQQDWEDLMDELANEEGSAIWVLELTKNTSFVTSRGGKRILHILQDYKLPSWLLEQFMYGPIRNMSEKSFIEWVEFLLNQTEPSAAYVGLGLYSTFYIRSDTIKILPNELTLQLLTNESFSEIPEGFQRGNNRTMLPYYWKIIAENFINSYPHQSLKLSSFMLKHFNSFDVIFSDSAPRSILRTIIEKHPNEVWVQIASYLEGSYAYQLATWLRGDDFFGTPRPEDKSVLPLIPQDIVWQWVEENVEQRAWYLATFVPPMLEKENTELSWVRQLLIRYGQRDDVRRNLTANFYTEGWTGNDSDHYARKKQELLTYQKTETNENVNQWLDDYIDNLEKRIELARIEEERRDF